MERGATIDMQGVHRCKSKFFYMMAFNFENVYDLIKVRRFFIENNEK